MPEKITVWTDEEKELMRRNAARPILEILPLFPDRSRDSVRPMVYKFRKEIGFKYVRPAPGEAPTPPTTFKWGCRSAQVDRLEAWPRDTEFPDSRRAKGADLDRLPAPECNL